MASEEATVIEQDTTDGLWRAYRRIPYALINQEMPDATQETLDEFTEICKYYVIYKKGAKFTVEGTNGDYVPARLRYKLAATLVNKEARFLFAEPPDIKVEAKGDVGKVSDDAKDALTVLNDLLTTVLEANMFEDALLKAAKDCFIGKRVAGLVNFNEEDGVTVTFLPSTQFVYETKVGNPNIITKFVAFIVVQDRRALSDKRIFKKKFVLGDDGIVYLEEILYDGAGGVIEVVTEMQETLLHIIPASIFINDGLTAEDSGESDIADIEEMESWYSRLSSADMDAGRKSMNPTKYTNDMDSRATKDLSTAPGSVWHLGTDQNLDSAHPLIGILEPNMSYSNPLKTTLERIKVGAYEAVDIPNVTLENLQGAVTSGKGLKAVYWPLIVRCKEKMKMWSPQLRRMAEIIIEGAMVYPNCVTRYITDPIVPVDYKITVEQNTPLPEDEMEERNMDMSEVDSQVMSRKAYMKKWRMLTDDEVEAELEQMAKERQILEDSAFGEGDGMEEPYPDEDMEMDDEEYVEDEALEDEDDYEDDPYELDDDAEGMAADMELDDMLQSALAELASL